MDLIVIGTMALDNIKTASGERRNLLGGSAAHFAMSARLFTKVHLVSIIGRDFPREHLRLLKKKGVDLSSVVEQEGKTFQWNGEYRAGDYNTAVTLATELGVLMNYLPRISRGQKGIPHVFLANFDPQIQMKFLRLMDKPKFVGLDSMNLWINNMRGSVVRLMKEVDLFVANDAEARALSGENNLIKAAKALRRMGPQWVVIKKGEHGVLFHCDHFMFSFPSYPVEDVIDPTGAGDTFAGGLMGYLSRSVSMGRPAQINERELKKAVIYAAAIASFNVEGFGTDQTANLTLAKVHRRMKHFQEFISL